MKLEVETKALADALKLAATCIRTSESVDILNHVLLDVDPDGLTIMATTLDREVRIRVPAKVERTGKRTAHAQMLRNFTSGSPAGTVSVGLKDGKLKVTSGRFGATIPSLDVAAFPSFMAQSEGQSFSFEHNEFQSALNQVAFCADDEQSFIYLTGVYVSPIRDSWAIMATDRHRFTSVEIDAPVGSTLVPFIYPKASARIASALFPDAGSGVEMFKTASTVTLSNERMAFSSKLVDAKFPEEQLRGVIVPGPHEIVVDKDEFSKAVSGVAGMVRLDENNKTRRIFISSAGSALKIATGANTTGAEAENEVQFEGEFPFKDIKVNADYLVDVLSFLNSGPIHLYFKQETTPIILRDDRAGALAFVFPLRF